jgi:hypothetical protein
MGEAFRCQLSASSQRERALALSAISVRPEGEEKKEEKARPQPAGESVALPLLWLGADR